MEARVYRGHTMEPITARPELLTQGSGTRQKRASHSHGGTFAALQEGPRVVHCLFLAGLAAFGLVIPVSCEQNEKPGPTWDPVSDLDGLDQLFTML